MWQYCSGSVSRSVTYINSCYWKLLGKYCQTITYALFYCSTVYTVILSTLLLLHHWDCYCHHIVLVIKIIWILIALNNNVNRQLTLGLRKLMEETTSVFWVAYDTGCTADLRFYCRVPGDDWHPIYLLFHSVTVSIVPQWYCEYCYCYWLPGCSTWFNARHLGRGPGYVWDPPKK